MHETFRRKWLISLSYTLIISVSLLILFSLTNCSSPEAEIPEHLKELDNLGVIQPNSEPVSFIELIRDMVIDDSDATKTWFKDISSGDFPFGGGEWFAGLEIDDSGRIYVGNRPETTIQVFSSEGSYLTKVGSEGNGPGELNGITSINIESDRLSVFDYLQFRTTFFSIESLKVDEVQNVYLNRSPDIEELTGWHANQIKFIDGDTFLVGYMEHPRDARVGRPTYNLDKERPIRYYFADREGEVLSDILFEIIDDDIITADVNGRHLYNWVPLPFLDGPLISISSSGHIFTADKEEFLIRMYAPNGDYHRAFYIPLEKKNLIRDELLRMYGEGDEENENLLIHAELPKKWPALGDIVIDDENRLWVSTIPDSEDLTYKWWVLQDTGELLATFTWPSNRSIEKIKDGYLYALETEESTGIQTIVKYRVEMD